jgi:SagB-type dehydrogenase family enzyme
MREIPEFLKAPDRTNLRKELAEEYLATFRDANTQRGAFFSLFGVAFDACCPASLLYHRNSSLSPEWECPLSEEEVSSLTLDLTYKRYPDAPQVALPETPPVSAPLEEAVRQRRTAVSFNDAAVSLVELAKLLQLACGLTQHGRLPLRAAPSPGALYAIESYPVAFNVTDLVPGVYHYVPAEHVVECLRALCGLEEIWSALPPGWHGETPALAVVLIARLPRVQAKYGERGYRFVLQESGHIAQNLLLASVALGLAAAGVGGFFDDAMNSLIGVDGEQELALYAILIGRSGANPSVNS